MLRGLGEPLALAILQQQPTYHWSVRHLLPLSDCSQAWHGVEMVGGQLGLLVLALALRRGMAGAETTGGSAIGDG